MAIKVIGSYFSNPANRNEENWTAIGKRMKQVAEEMDTSEDQMFAKLLVRLSAHLHLQRLQDLSAPVSGSEKLILGTWFVCSGFG
jgi:hypothetical protein